MALWPAADARPLLQEEGSRAFVGEVQEDGNQYQQPTDEKQGHAGDDDV